MVREISGYVKLDLLFQSEFNKLSEQLLDEKNQHLKSQIIRNHLYYLKKEYNLDVWVQPIFSGDDNSEKEYWGDFDSYFQFHKVQLQKKTSVLSCTELGQYFTIISRAAFDSGRIEHIKPKSPMKRKDIVELLQITNEPCKILIDKLMTESLLKVAEGKLKNAVACPRTLVQRNSKNFKPEKISTVEKFKSMWFISTHVLECKIFMKNDKSDRKSSGKETLGVFIKLVLYMNELNEVKPKNKQSIINYITNFIEVAGIQLHLEILINQNLIQLDNNIVYINPTAVKKSKKTISQKLVDMFKLDSGGMSYNRVLGFKKNESVNN